MRGTGWDGRGRCRGLAVRSSRGSRGAEDQRLGGLQALGDASGEAGLEGCGVTAFWPMPAGMGGGRLTARCVL